MTQINKDVINLFSLVARVYDYRIDNPAVRCDRLAEHEAEALKNCAERLGAAPRIPADPSHILMR